MYETWLCETGDSHSGVIDYKSLLGYNLSMIKRLLTFVRPLLPPSSGLKHLQDTGNVLPVYTISYPRRQIFITKLIWGI